MKRKRGILTRRRVMIMSSLFAVGILVTIVNIFVGIVTAKEAESLTFPSADGLQVTADVYLTNNAEKRPFIVLFHQAKWSRGEYRETAPRLNRLGYNCLAVDLRSGNKVAGVTNMTALKAREKGKQTRFVDAMQDMVAALNYVKETYNPPRLLMLGSSYSAGLALKVAGDNPGLVDGVMAFSPAEYFVKNGMSHTWVLESAKNISVPVFITSARKEKNRWTELYNAVNTDTKLSFVPNTAGKHGSRALWNKYPDSEEYWNMLEQFLKSYF